MAETRRERPLSPHLQVYRPLINMVMSILHRITGVALYFGTLLLAAWLMAAAYGPEPFRLASEVFGSLPGRIVLFGYTWALMHHMLGGLRHFVWDTGAGYELGTVNRLSWGTIVGSVLLTGLIWLLAMRG
jgi:succinate dehydrogenase / fumarate reductase cytochrome b subunit